MNVVGTESGRGQREPEEKEQRRGGHEGHLAGVIAPLEPDDVDQHECAGLHPEVRNDHGRASENGTGKGTPMLIRRCREVVSRKGFAVRRRPEAPART